MAVDSAVVQKDGLAIGGVHQLVAVLDHAGTRGKRLQDQEFSDCEPHLFALPAAQVAVGIHQQFTLPDNVGAGRIHAFLAGAAQHGANARQKQPLRERLGNIVVSPHAEAERLVQLVILAGQKDHRQVRTGPDFLQKFHAVHPRHLDVENRQFHGPARQPLQRGFAIMIAIDLEPFALQRQRHRRQNVLVVIYKRNSRCHLVTSIVHIWQRHHALHPPLGRH